MNKVNPRATRGIIEQTEVGLECATIPGPATNQIRAGRPPVDCKDNLLARQRPGGFSMQFYECHVCGEEFGSDYVGGRQTPKYCPDCKAFPDTGMVAVYGLQTKGGAIRYVGSTMNPVQRLATHRSRTEGGPLSEWMANVGADNVRMAILHVVAADEARRYEEIERLRRKRLLNRRAARQKVFTEEQVRAMLTEFFEKHDGSIDKVL